MIQITDDNFKAEVQDYNKPVVVDFFSVNCAPCRTLAPIFANVESKVTSYKFAKADVATAMQVFVDNSVTAMPTLIKFDKGKETARNVGSMSEQALIAWLNK
jgi:thioredoxin